MANMKTDTLGVPLIEVYFDRVVICGTTIERPAAIAPAQWMSYWERVKE